MFDVILALPTKNSERYVVGYRISKIWLAFCERLEIMGTIMRLVLVWPLFLMLPVQSFPLGSETVAMLLPHGIQNGSADGCYRLHRSTVAVTCSANLVNAAGLGRCDRQCSHRGYTNRRCRQRPSSATSSASSLYATVPQEDCSSGSSTTMSTRQKIAVIGTGAVGSYYGARLWQAGHDVHFLMRGIHYETAVSKQEGLRIDSVEGNVHIPSAVLQAYPTTAALADAVMTTARPYDWVIVALKSTALDAIPDLIVPLLTPNATRVLVIMNGMIEDDLLRLMRLRTGQTTVAMEDAFVRGSSGSGSGSSSTLSQSTPLSPPPLQCCRAWYGGMALICCNRIAPAVIQHTFFGLLSAGVASTTGSSQNDHEDDRQAFIDLFANTVVQVAFEESLRHGRWKKMLWNLPFNGISVAMAGITVDQIVQDRGLRRLAYAIMDETILAANAELELEQRHYTTDSQGTIRTSASSTSTISPLGIVERAAMMKLSDDMGPYKPSTMLDFVHRRAMEVQYLFRTPLTRAQRLGIPVPHLATIVTQIEAHQRLHNLY
jgi:2-dehydropantoate 2-reductase